MQIRWKHCSSPLSDSNSHPLHVCADFSYLCLDFPNIINTYIYNTNVLHVHICMYCFTSEMILLFVLLFLTCDSIVCLWNIASCQLYCSLALNWCTIETSASSTYDVILVSIQSYFVRTYTIQNFDPFRVQFINLKLHKHVTVCLECKSINTYQWGNMRYTVLCILNWICFKYKSRYPLTFYLEGRIFLHKVLKYYVMYVRSLFSCM